MTRPRFLPFELSFLTALLGMNVYCGGDDESAAADGSTGTPEGPGRGDAEGGPVEAAGRCDYSNPFTSTPECREYTGVAWTAESITTACGQLQGTVMIGVPCARDALLGTCVTDEGTPEEILLVLSGADASACAASQQGCEVFGGGRWEAAGLCAGGESGGEDDTGALPPQGAFIQPFLDCRPPIEGEPAGDGPDGDVCTWQTVAGSTEEGRRFLDYGDCDVIYTQRPYYPAPPAFDPPPEDPRLEDEDYAAELAWVRAQVEASACVCCHSSVAPAGSSNWTIDAPGNWVYSFRDEGLAMGAGWVDDSALGAYPAEENNGFARPFGIPTTDVDRMQAFFEAELAHRGKVREDFAETPAFGGPIHTQRFYEPEPCTDAAGVDADGTVRWEGGDARYVYVLDVGSQSPTVPPNLDLPEGTLWRLDVTRDGTPLASGSIRYGEAPSGTSQRYPDGDAPEALVAGETYYLYVTQDVGIPLTRCLFVAE